MQGDLISRKELIEMIEGTEELLDFQKDECIACINACDVAYDVEKVVIGLIEASYIESVDDIDPFGDMPCLVVNLDTATSIVRNGGKE